MDINEHSFVVVAYGQSPYLEDCLRSLVRQTVQTPIIICTSTPFEGLKEIAEKYRAELIVHRPNRGIGHDWNQALQSAKTALVTLAHQDDVYAPDFSESKLAAHRKFPRAAISFSGADEVLEDGRRRGEGRNSLVKRLLVGLAFFGCRTFKGGLRKLLLFGFGNPVFCTSVTFNTQAIGAFRFREDLRTNMDWVAWIELCERSGIIRVKRSLARRRVHATSETAACITDGARLAEDALVFNALWPSGIASLIGAVYRLSYSGYR